MTDGQAQLSAFARARNAILQKYGELGGAAGWLGPVARELERSSIRGGCFSDYQGGSIYWSDATGAHEVHGAIRDKWHSLGTEGGFLGYPLTDETRTPPPNDVGRYNHFEGGSIYWTPSTGAHEVHGDIRGRWASLGWEQSHLGFPTKRRLLRQQRPSSRRWADIIIFRVVQFTGT